MDVKLSTQSVWLGSVALALLLGEASLVTADEAIASDSGATTFGSTTTIFISDDSPSEPPSPPQSVEILAAETSAEGSVVFIEDTPVLAPAPVNQTPVSRSTINRATIQSLPMAGMPNQSVARGDLKVVSNQQQQRALAAVRPLPNLSSTVQLPAMPKATIKQVATVQPVAAPTERDQPGDVQIAVHTETVAPKRVTPKTGVDLAAELLISSHQLSLEAKTASDYTKITLDCAEAIRQGAQSEQHRFARQLSSWAMNRRGQLRSDDGEQDLANADFQAALDYHPRNWRALHNRGVSFAQTGKFAEAFDDFNTVIQLNPNFAKAYANRATLYVQAKDIQAAIKDYETAIERDENFATAYVGLGRVCHMMGRWDDAVEHFTAAIQIEPTSPDVVCSRGDLQADRGHYGEALADYARTIELDPEFAHAYRNGAWLLATCPDERFRDPENAVLGAQQALEYSYGERHVALDTLAAAQASDGQFEAAIATVKQAVDQAPEATKYTYLARLQLYQESEPFRTEPVGEVSQATYDEGGE